MPTPRPPTWQNGRMPITHPSPKISETAKMCKHELYNRQYDILCTAYTLVVSWICRTLALQEVHRTIVISSKAELQCSNNPQLLQQTFLKLHAHILGLNRTKRGKRVLARLPFRYPQSTFSACLSRVNHRKHSLDQNGCLGSTHWAFLVFGSDRATFGPLP